MANIDMNKQRAFGQQVCALLGLDPGLVETLEIRISAKEIMRVVVTMYGEADRLGPSAEFLRQYVESGFAFEMQVDKVPNRRVLRFRGAPIDNDGDDEDDDEDESNPDETDGGDE